jgi:hypothetical protein
VADVVAAGDLAHGLAVLVTAANRLALSSRVAIPTSHDGRQAADHVGPDAVNRRFARAAGVDDLDPNVVEAGVSPKLNDAPRQRGRTAARRIVDLAAAAGAGAPRRSRPGKHLGLKFRHSGIDHQGLPVMIWSIAATCAALSAGVGNRSAIKAA